MKKNNNRIVLGILAMLVASYSSAQVSDQQIKDFFASNPTPQQIAAAAASLGMNASQISAAMGVANYGGTQAARDAAVNSWVGTQSNGYSWNAQGQIVNGAAASNLDPVGVNQASLEKGIWSPVERRWISNDELRAFGATNPSQEQMMQQAIKLGLNPQTINHAAYVISGASDVRDPKYADLNNKLNSSMYSGQYGYGYSDDFSQGAALVRGNGTIHYLMPDGSGVSIRIHNGIPDQSYAQVLAEFNASKGQGSNSQSQFQLDTSWQNGCYPSAASAPPGAKICVPPNSQASIPVPITTSQYSNAQHGGTENAASGSSAANAASQISQSAVQAAVGSSSNRVCPAGMTITMTRSGIRKCLGTMIREIPAEIPIPKGGLQQPMQTQQTQQTQKPTQQWVRVETIQAQEYVGRQNAATNSGQGFLIPNDSGYIDTRGAVNPTADYMQTLPGPSGVGPNGRPVFNYTIGPDGRPVFTGAVVPNPSVP